MSCRCTSGHCPVRMSATVNPSLTGNRYIREAKKETPTAHAVGVFASSGCMFLVLVVIAGFLFSVVQQQKHVGPLPLRDLGCACDVVGDPLFTGGRLCGRRAVIVRRFVVGSVARAASPLSVALGCDGRLSVRSSVRCVCGPIRAGARDADGRTDDYRK
jgi:hypothetical protein